MNLSTGGSDAGRYELLRVLGAGGSGVVHEARDLRRGGRVALKRLHRESPLDVARLRQEFRALADVLHPNLVRLHELSSEGDQTLLTMDVVDGRPLLHFVWDIRRRPDATLPTGDTWSTLSPYARADADEPAGSAPSLERPPIDEALIRRLRTAIRGLATGLQALHAVGLLHRDVKPSNVLVDDRGHVTLLDFGLALRPGASSPAIAGTVPYMSPEQALGDDLQAASDWYAVGVCIFEALTGRTPFLGSSAQMMFDKQVHDAPRVLELAPDAPADLADLCQRLLARDPVDRPDGDAVCATLGVPRVGAATASPFVGRAEEIGRLTQARLGGGRQLVTVQAPSGFGKTRLVEQWLGELPLGTLVLAARCYERDQSRFKALDPLIHTLSAALEADPSTDATTIRDLGLATVLFPSLARISGPTPIIDVDPATARRRATRAVRELLIRVCSRRPTVLWIDDLQWADLDSMRIIAEIFGGDDAPACVLILGHRSDDPQAEWLLAPIEALVTTRIALAPLSTAEAAELAGALLGDRHDLTARVVDEAAGSPFVLSELARWLAGGGSGVDEGSLWRRVLDARTGDLPDSTRALLEVVAVGARPMAPELALAAARDGAPHAGPGDVTTLTVQRLLTTRRGRDLECTHDRIREGLTAQIAAGRARDIHRSIAQCMGTAGDPELLSEHWEQAGEAAIAAAHARRAAASAEAIGAFERAANLYRRALRLGVSDAAAVRAALGQALAWAGHSDAADVLLEAASAHAGAERARLERAATNQLLRSGQYTRAYALLPQVLAEVGMRWPHNRTLALAEAGVNMVRAQLPLPRWRTPAPGALEVVSELAMSLSYADMIRAAVFSTRAILIARDSEDPAQRAVAFAMRASNASLLGESAVAAQYVARAWEAAGPDPSPALWAAVALHEGIVDTAEGRFERACDRLDRSVRHFDDTGGRPYELNMGRTFLVYSLLQSGRVAEYRALRARAIEDCQLRGMRVFESLFRTTYPLQPGLLDDDPDAVEANLREAEARWAEPGSTVWLYAQVSWTLLEVYRGHARAAHARAEALHRDAASNLLLRVAPNALIVHIARAAAAAPLAAADPAARRSLDDAVTALAKVPSAFSASNTHTWRAASAFIAGHHEQALRENSLALAALERHPVPWHRAMVDAQRARFLGEPADAAWERLAALGVRNPAALCGLYAWAP